MPATMTIWVGNDVILEVAGLRESITGALQNNLSTSQVTASLKNDDGSALTTPIAVTMTYASGSDGVYRGIIPYTAGVTAGKNYLVFLEANAGSNMVGHWEFRCVAKARSE